MHLRVKGRGATLAGVAALAAAAAALAIAPTAGAAVTASQITTPANPSYYVNNDANGQKITISGTSNGTTGDAVDILCYFGNHFDPVSANVPVNADGSFSTIASLHPVEDTECTLHAVPAGTTPADVSPYTGPTIGIGENFTYKNGGAPYDYYDWAQQSKGAFDYQSLGSCGVEDGYLYDPTFVLTTTTFNCDAYLWGDAGLSSSNDRSELQVDGANAYAPSYAQGINASATGFPAFTYSYSVNRKTGDYVLHETDPIVKCLDPTFPPNASSCPSFVSTGIVDHRTITQNHDGEIAWVTDVFKSTDGKPHKLDLLWENDNKFHPSPSGSSALLEYKFPGQSGYSTHLVGDTVSLPAKPGTIDIRMQGAADGDTTTGRGAIVYDRPVTSAQFFHVHTDWAGFLAHQTAKVTGKSSAQFRFAYVQDYHQATVDKLARLASATFKGCIVPKVTGKSLAKAKSALERAGCSVGKVSQAFSATVKKGDVVSEKPGSGSHLAYLAKVALVESKGK